MKKNLLPLALLLLGTTAYSQVGIGTLTPNKSSQLDVVSTNKGILIPRVALENSVDTTTITTGNVSSLLVFNTNTKSDITPGYYYWFDSKWMRVINDADVIALDKNTTNTSLTMINGELVLTDSDGNIVSIPLSQINIVTTLSYNNTSNELTYTGENGTPVVLDLNEGSVAYNAATNIITYTDEAGVDTPLNLNNTDLAYDAATSTLSYVNTLGATQTIDLGQIVAVNETNTTLSLTAGELVYNNENANNANVKLISTDTGNTITAGTDGALFAAAVEPWNVENTSTKATLNNQNIYQNGNVGIGDFSASKPVTTLDVRGALRVGQPHADEVSGASVVGQESVAIGADNRITGGHSIAVGDSNLITSWVSGVVGRNNTIGTNTPFNGIASFVTGANNILNSNYSLVTGSHNNVVTTLAGYGNNLVGGRSNTVSGNVATAFMHGSNNTVTGLNSAVLGEYNISATASELVFGHYNAITTVTAGGSSTNWRDTDPVLQIGNGTSAVRGNAITVLKNGKTAIGVIGVDATAKPTELLDIGGTATAGLGGLKIRNINSAAYTGNTATDKMVVADATGVLKTAAIPSSINIYNANGTLTANRTVTMGGNNLTFTSPERDIIFDSNGRIANIAKPGFEADIFLSSGSGATYNRFDLQSFSNGQTNLTASGAGAQQLLLGTHATQVAAPLLFSTSAGGGALGTEKMRITGTGNVGIAANVPTEKLDVGQGNVRIRDINSNAGTASDKIVVADADGVLKTVNTAAPKFFYAPSIVLPTNSANLQSGVTYDMATETFTVNLHDIYNNQFGMTGDVAGAARTAIKSPTATTLTTYAANALEYFVTYFDNTVFDPTTITLSDAGIMTYKVLPSSTVTEKTYMNIVFKVK